MASKRRKGGGSGTVWRVSSEEATLRMMPRYSGFACGHGPHGDVKYNRAKEKRLWLDRDGI